MSSAAPDMKLGVADDKNDWKTQTAASGVPYYYNTKTKKTQWEKPDVLKSNEERQNETDWQELTTADGKTFYYNPKIKKSVWKMPPELKALKDKQAEQRRLMLATGQLKGNTGGIKINLSFDASNSLGLDDSQNQQEDEPRFTKQKKENKMSEEEARKIFMDLLKEKASPSLRWDQAHQLLMSDDRYKVIKSVSGKKQLFKEYVQQQKKLERNEVRNRLEQARENFMKMLDENKTFNSDAKFHKTAHLFANDPRYKALEERDRENCFQDYLDKLYDQEKEAKRQQKKELSEKLRNMFAGDLRVTVETHWDDICELYRDSEVWTGLNEYDRLTVFADYIMSLEKSEGEERRKNRRQQERLNREAFRQLLDFHEKQGTLSYKSKWKSFLQLIKADERFTNMLGQPGSTPYETFEDRVELLKEDHKKFKEDIKHILKHTGLKMSTKTTKEEFMAAIKENPELQQIALDKSDAYFKYFAEKAASKEKEVKRKQKKNIKRFNKFLKSLKEVKADSQYKTFEARIKEQGPSSFPLLTEEEYPKLFEAYTKELKHGEEGLLSDDDEAGKKKKNKKGKKRKSKRKGSDDSDHEVDASDADSDTERRSTSHRMKKTKKDRKKKDKRDPSQSDDEDGSRSPSATKRVKKEGDIAPVNMLKQENGTVDTTKNTEEKKPIQEEDKKSVSEVKKHLPEEKKLLQEEKKTMDIENTDDKQREAGEIAKEAGEIAKEDLQVLQALSKRENSKEQGLIEERKEEKRSEHRKERKHRDRSDSRDSSRSRSRNKKKKKKDGKRSTKKDSKKHKKKSSKKRRDDSSSSGSEHDR